MFTHKILFLLAGFIWFVVGFSLLRLGIVLLAGNEETFGLLLIAGGLLLGLIKGRLAMGKVAKREMSRIRTYPNPTSIRNLYSRTQFLVIFFMMALGMTIKYLHLPDAVRGFIDVTVGSALINGAVIYGKGFLEPVHSPDKSVQEE